MDRLLASIERTAHLIGLHLERSASTLGVTQAEAHVLAHLQRADAMSIADLHRASALKRSTLTNVLDRLERRRLVRRAPNPADRRSIVVELTASGRTAASRVANALDELERAVRARLSGSDLKSVEAVAAAIDSVVQG